MIAWYWLLAPGFGATVVSGVCIWWAMIHTQKQFPDIAGKGIRFHEKDVVYELWMDETTVAWDKKEITINHRINHRGTN